MRFKNPQARQLMALVLALDPSIKGALRQLFKMGAYNIRPDYMYVSEGRRSEATIHNPQTEKYERTEDPCAWNADLDAFGRKNAMGVSLLRSRQGEWFLNGC
jgi:hypothetical protein